jgi:hypothetical protein
MVSSGDDSGETDRALLHEERFLPVVVQHVRPVDPYPQATTLVAACTAWVGPTGPSSPT